LIHFYKRDVKMLRLVGLTLLLLAAYARAECEDDLCTAPPADGGEEAAAASPGEIEEEEGVLVLGQENFDKAISENSMVLVEFYAPWCGHCKKLAPEYEAAARLLAADGSSVKLAKVDATQHKGLASQYGVKGYPTLKFFRDGEAFEYTGGRTADTIKTWLDKKSGPPATPLTEVEAAEEFAGKAKVTVLGFFKDQESDEAKAFLKAAGGLDEQQFGITSEQALYTKFDINADNKVILLKKFDEGRADLKGEITVDSVRAFVKANALPLVVDFNQDTAKQIFGDNNVKGHFIVFSSAADEKHEHRLHAARNIAKDYKGEIMFVSVTVDEEEHKRVLDFFGIWTTPTFRIANVNEDFVKYKPAEDDFSEEYMRNFVSQYKAGELFPDLKTEEVPEDWDANDVKVLVGKNFEAVAMDTEKDVLVEFYAPWCGHCKKLAPIWDELGEKFKDVEDVVIAKMDATLNECKDIKVKGFPTIKLIQKGDNKILDYNGDRTLNSFIEMLRPEMVEKEEVADDEEAEVKEEKKDEL